MLGIYLNNAYIDGWYMYSAEISHQHTMTSLYVSLSIDSIDRIKVKPVTYTTDIAAYKVFHRQVFAQISYNVVIVAKKCSNTTHMSFLNIDDEH